MAEYQVVWEIELSAETPRQAASEALDCILNSDARVFYVTDKAPVERVIVDLAQGDFPVEDWKYAVSNGDTVLGYHEWNQHKLESE